MILRVTAGGARDDHVVAHFERVSGHTRSAELVGAPPLDAVAHHGAVLLLHHHVHEGMGIPELELHQLALDLHALIFEIRGRERVMRVSLRRDDKRRCDSQTNEVALHIVAPPLAEPGPLTGNRSRKTPPPYGPENNSGSLRRPCGVDHLSESANCPVRIHLEPLLHSHDRRAVAIIDAWSSMSSTRCE